MSSAPAPLTALALTWSLLAALGCATARLTGAEPSVMPDSAARQIVVLEPFFESATWVTKSTTEQAQIQGGTGLGRQVEITRQVAQKPVYARLSALAQEHRRVLEELQQRRPSWQVTSTGGLPALSGRVHLVRVVVGEPEVVESNRALKNLAFAFGLVILPLQLINIEPVHEVQRVHGTLTRYQADAETLRPRLLRYPTQPDFAVDTRGLTPLTRPFGLDIEFEEGVLASEASREPVLVEGFSRRLAAAVVALVEEP